MGITAVIVFGTLAWVLTAILVALFVARVIRNRDRQRPVGTEQTPPADGTWTDGAQTRRTPARRTPPSWRLRNKI